MVCTCFDLSPHSQLTHNESQLNMLPDVQMFNCYLSSIDNCSILENGKKREKIGPPLNTVKCYTTIKFLYLKAVDWTVSIKRRHLTVGCQLKEVVAHSIVPGTWSHWLRCHIPQLLPRCAVDRTVFPLRYNTISSLDILLRRWLLWLWSCVCFIDLREGLRS